MIAPGAIEPETDLERRIVGHPCWREGAAWGSPDAAHPEDSVADHIADVLRNVDRVTGDPHQRRRLRLIALLHDTLKHRVRWWHPARNDHARLARRFAECFTDDAGVLRVIEHHDDAYRIWRRARRTGRWRAAERRAARLIDRLGDDLELFLAFYRCDNDTGGKSPDDRLWFERVLARSR